MEVLKFIAVACLLYSLAHNEFVASVAVGGSALSFLVVGDWGRKGLFNQSRVAAQMEKVGQQLQIDFVISTGDNLYEDGLTGIDDPNLAESFSNIYTGNSLHKTWHIVLGNHDYRGDTLAQLDPALRSRDSRWHCYRTSTLKQNLPLSCKGPKCPFVHFFFIDTTPFVNEYWGPSKHRYDWRGVLPRKGYLQRQLKNQISCVLLASPAPKDLNNALKGSQATWKIVVGHHPIRSIGSHDDTVELVNQLLPILEANRVDLYINGHAHCLQDFTSKTSSIHFLTSGGGSKAWGGVSGNPNKEELQFFYDGQGFMSVQIAPEFIHAKFYDIEGNSLHEVNLSKS